MSPKAAAVFLDRDGVINRLVQDPGTGTMESPYTPADVDLVPGASDAIELLRDAGFTLVVASNQPGAAKGVTTEQELDAVHERVVDLLGDASGAVTEWRYCRHHPNSPDQDLRDCDCRKPKPGLLRDAAADLGINLSGSWMVGDADRDIAAGAAAGCRTILVENPDSAHRREGAVQADIVVADVSEAASRLMQRPDARPN